MNSSLMRGLFFGGCALLLFSLLTACTQTTGKDSDDGRLQVVTTFYPLYDFALKIGGEHVAVKNLVPAGVDPHDWTAKPRDIQAINTADMFLYNGAGFELWVDDMIDSMDEQVQIVEASRGITLLAGEPFQGHEEDEHDHGKYDPHVWISPLRAIELAENIKRGLIKADPMHKEDYQDHFEILLAKLEQLDEDLKQAVSDGKRDHIVVSHTAFAYLAADYGFEQIAVMGLSPQAEPTIGQLKQISDFIKQQDVQYILFEELVSPKIAETLARDLSVETLVFNPLEGLTEEQINSGEDYFSVMRKNIEALQTALQ